MNKIIKHKISPQAHAFKGHNWEIEEVILIFADLNQAMLVGLL